MADPITYRDYTATAGQTDFAFNFPYLEDEHVTVEINGVAQNPSSYSVIVESNGDKLVRLNPPGATAGQIVRVRRKSQPGTDLVDFVNGSVLTESELDRAYLHNRYLAEEISELNDASLQLEQGGTNWDAKSLQIKNVADPTNTTDATNKTYVDQKVNQASTGAAFPPTKWTFTGTAGANTTYSVTGAEINGDTAYDVSIDGAVKEPTADYTVDPDTDTLTIVPTLSGGEDIVVIQRGFGIAISTGTIGSSQIASGAIDESKLATDAITTAKIEDGAVTPAKLDDTQAYTVTGLISNANIGIKRASQGPGLRLTYDASTDEVRDLFVDNNGDFIFTNVSGTQGSPGTLATLDSNGNLDITGNYKKGGNNLLLDEDTMSSNSSTLGATQQSIKAYVDSQSGAAGTPNYSTGWFNNSTGLANGGTYTFTHNLGTSNLTATIWVADDASGTNAQEVRNYFHANASAEYGAVLTSISTTSTTLQLLQDGWIAINSSGVGPGLSISGGESWAGHYVKVVLSASATVGAVSSFESSDITWTAGTSGTNPAQNNDITVSHGLGGVPDNFSVALKCTTAENGWSIGEEASIDYESSTNGRLSIWSTSTVVGFRFNSGTTGNPFELPVKTAGSGSTFNPNASNWKLVFRAQIFS